MASTVAQFDQGLGHGLVNMLRTGNVILDMLICLVLPMMLRRLLNTEANPRSLLAPLLSWISRRSYTRVIEYVEGGNTRYFMDSYSIENTDRNNLLQKAIRLFIANTYQIQSEEMETNLVPQQKLNLEVTSDIYGRREAFNGSYQQLLSFGVNSLPQKGRWTLIDREEKIWFLQTRETNDPSGKGEGPVQTKTSFWVRAYGKNASSAVESWIVRAFDWYKAVKKAEQDDSRYFFTVSKIGGSDKDAKASKGPKYTFKKYILSDHKTFRSLFFPEKECLMRLVQQFLMGEGKFAIEGFPNKLGLLLDGPPGTGKTSLIKALAHHTGRHIVSVNLSRIETNQQLMDVLFDLVFPEEDGEFPLKMNFEEIIFVMEDIDAASKVVYAREKPKSKESRKSKSKGSVAHKKDSHSFQKVDDEISEIPPLVRLVSGGCDTDSDGNDDKAVKENGPKDMGAVMGEMMSHIAAATAGCSSDQECPNPLWGPRSTFVAEDKLNLAGLLNVLDGVVDSPGRIIVMTTNFPEKLDPALIRPGRINKRIHLDYVKHQALCDMAEHYLRIDLDDKGRGILEEIASQFSLSPAQVEQCCAEAEGFEDLMSLLRSSP